MKPIEGLSVRSFDAPVRNAGLRAWVNQAQHHARKHPDGVDVFAKMLPVVVKRFMRVEDERDDAVFDVVDSWRPT